MEANIKGDKIQRAVVSFDFPEDLRCWAEIM